MTEFFDREIAKLEQQLATLKRLRKTYKDQNNGIQKTKIQPTPRPSNEIKR